MPTACKGTNVSTVSKYHCLYHGITFVKLMFSATTHTNDKSCDQIFFFVLNDTTINSFQVAFIHAICFWHPV